MKIRIHVTKSRIAKGVPASFSHCPIALAVKPRLKRNGYTGVVMNRLSIGSSTLLLPERACKFYREFDSGLPVSPTSFTLDIPQKFLK